MTDELIERTFTIRTQRGPRGRQVELRSTATHLQWRYEGDAAWVNLIALTDIQAVSHTHDDRYYTEAEIDAALAAQNAALDDDLALEARNRRNRCWKLMNRWQDEKPRFNPLAYVMRDRTVMVSGRATWQGVTTAIALPTAIPMPAGLGGQPDEVVLAGRTGFVVTDTGDVAAWGEGSAGEIGDGGSADRHRPVLISAANITPRSAGGANRRVTRLVTNSPCAYDPDVLSVYARCADATLWAWGANAAGGWLGVNTTTGATTPTQCLREPKAGGAAVVVADCSAMWAAGGDRGIAAYITTAGKVLLAGHVGTAHGRGSGGTNPSLVFREVKTVSEDATSQLPDDYVARKVVLLPQDYANADPAVIIITTTDNAYVCGFADATTPFLGIGVTSSVNTFRHMSAYANNVEDIWAVMDIYGGAIMQPVTGNAVAWGRTTANRLPVATTNPSAPVALKGVLAAPGSKIVDVRTGGGWNSGFYATSVALLADGRVAAWGNNAVGNDAAQVSTDTPFFLDLDLTGASSVEEVVGSGAYSEMAVGFRLSDDGALAGGYGGESQLGNGVNANQFCPTHVRFSL